MKIAEFVNLFNLVTKDTDKIKYRSEAQKHMDGH